MTPELPSDFDYSRTDLEGVLQMIETGHMSVACASHYIKNIFEIIDAIKARTKKQKVCPHCKTVLETIYYIPVLETIYYIPKEKD